MDTGEDITLLVSDVETAIRTVLLRCAMPASLCPRLFEYSIAAVLAVADADALPPASIPEDRIMERIRSLSQIASQSFST
jgi:hypothetical protein